MVKAYRVGQSMIVPLEFDLDGLRDIFRQPRSMRLDEDEIKMKEFYDKVTQTFPDFLDQRVHYYGGKPSFYGEGPETNVEITYEVPLERGRVSAMMMLAKDLRTCIRKTDFDSLSDERKSSLLQVISGRSGLIVQGQYRYGTDDNQGLYFGIDFDAFAGKSRRGRLDNIPDPITQAVMNALCTSKPLRLQDEEQEDYSPLSFHSREIRANMKDLRLEALNEAEPHIDEFFSWVRSRTQEIQTVLVMSNWYNKLIHLENELQELQESKRISLKKMPASAAPILETIAGLMNELHPPKNKRMDYFVNS